MSWTKENNSFMRDKYNANGYICQTIWLFTDNYNSIQWHYSGET